jgi:tetratricopeptide (TPR) repeat protein
MNGASGDKSVTLLTSAVQDALRATALSPRSADAWNTLATLYAYSRSLTPTALDESYKAMEKALQLEPTNALLAWRLATLYQSSAEWQKAEQYAIQAIMLKPNYVDAYVTLAQIYEGAGERNKAFQVFAAGEQYLNQSPIAMFEYGRLLYNEGSDAATVQAKLVWEKALELQPNYADAIYGLRRLSERTGDKVGEQTYKDKLRSLGVQVE